MKILITGSSRGIGKACAELFLEKGHSVCGIDILPSSIFEKTYVHYTADISKKETLPEISNVEILINNAGTQTALNGVQEKDIQTNLIGTMNVTERYAFQSKIKSVLFNSSASAVTGNEFSSYAASKAGINGYMKNCAIRLANSFRATANALCFGGVYTELNDCVIKDKTLWNKIMDVTPLKRWLTVEEAAKWCYFMTVENTFCTGQEIVISGGERNCADLFVWN